jgi:hypothetical protein
MLAHVVRHYDNVNFTINPRNDLSILPRDWLLENFLKLLLPFLHPLSSLMFPRDWFLEI